jgi:hypothetical protein
VRATLSTRLDLISSILSQSMLRLSHREKMGFLYVIPVIPMQNLQKHTQENTLRRERGIKVSSTYLAHLFLDCLLYILHIL